MSSTPILEARSLSKKFSLGGKVLEVIRDVSFSIEQASSLSIRGESGCGKTTLLNLLARIEQADSGELLWGDQWMRCDRPATRTEIATRASFLGVVYQAYYLVPELDVLENVLLPARISGNLNQAVTERAQKLLDQMGVADKARQIPGKLSGGERQRVAIARALINQPKVLLADEPTGNLDERTGVDVMNLLLRTCSNEGASLVLVTHNPSFAQSTDRQLFLSEGQMNEV
ncbi:MAG: ABC transporter ATP-binding protein [Opitutales bacterium]